MRFILNTEIERFKRGNIIVGSNDRDKFEEYFKSFVNEIRNSNDGVILFIDGIHLAINTKNKSMDLFEIFNN